MIACGQQPGFITSRQFSGLTGLKKRAAVQALAGCHEGKAWREHALIVVTQRGRGGCAGRSYLVRVDSLPPDLRQRAEAMFGIPPDITAPAAALPAPATGTALAAPDVAPLALPVIAAGAVAATRRWEWVMAIIRPALALPEGSRERAEMIRRLTQQNLPMPSGDTQQFSKTTLYRWIAEYEKKGLGGLERKGRSDRGRTRVLISRLWDKVVPFPDKVKKRIAANLDTYVKSVWAKAGGGKGRGSAKTGGGWNNVCNLARKELVKMTRAAGLDLPMNQLLGLCAVPRRFAEQHRNYAIIALKNNDAKAFFDTALPRTRRTREGMVPMELVVGDVHKLDIYLRRVDGSLYTPYLIAWSDVATNRIRWTVVFPEKGRGIRQEDVIKSFIEMVQDPEWGMPQALYLDNGSEYFKMNFINDAMRLTACTQDKDFRVGFTSDDPEISNLVEEAKSARRKAVVNAQPYNAPAKPIEGLFAVLEGGPFAMVPGWIGGNRMKAKTKNVGHEPHVYPGQPSDLVNALTACSDFYHTKDQTGSLNGLMNPLIFICN